jgi:glycosyltransferase involved in cell wall biosynthesis
LERGAAVQMNVGPLAGAESHERQDAARRLLRTGLPRALATDAHPPDRPYTLEQGRTLAIDGGVSEADATRLVDGRRAPSSRTDSVSRRRPGVPGRMDHGAVIVAPDGTGSLAGYARALCESTEAPRVVVKGCSGGFGHGLLSPYSLRCAAADAAVVRRLRRLDASLLHLASHHLARYGRFIQRPYVVTVHDLIRYRDWKERGTRTPLIHEPNLRDSLHLQLDAAGLRRAAALIAVSEHTKRELIRLLDIPPARIHVVREGVDRRAFRRVSRRLLREPYVLYVGSEQPRKNLATLFKAFMRARAAVPDLKLVKVGAAGGPEAPFRAKTLEHARASGVLPHLLFAERVPHGELVAWYSGALCLVQPSCHEGFGLPPLEAMACGCPVIASDAGALPEVAADAGVVYGAAGDVEALASALTGLVSSPARRARLASAGRERAAEMPWERTAAQTREVWRSVLVEPLEAELVVGDLAGRRTWHPEVGHGGAGLIRPRFGDPAGEALRRLG